MTVTCLLMARMLSNFHSMRKNRWYLSTISRTGQNNNFNSPSIRRRRCHRRPWSPPPPPPPTHRPQLRHRHWWRPRPSVVRPRRWPPPRPRSSTSAGAGRSLTHAHAAQTGNRRREGHAISPRISRWSCCKSHIAAHPRARDIFTAFNANVWRRYAHCIIIQ